jgi:hypothetical protein
MGHLSPEKRALFSLLKKVGGHMPQLPSRFRGPWALESEIFSLQLSSLVTDVIEKAVSEKRNPDFLKFCSRLYRLNPSVMVVLAN